jgi:DNA-binding transcriptional LysR family regulator
MDTRCLRAFVTVADMGGISAAAQHLGYAQSSLSAQISRLEGDLGVNVLRRTNTGTELTEAGCRLLPHAREALDVDGRMRSAVAGCQPSLRIGALESLASEWLPDILVALGHGAAGQRNRADVSLSVANRERLMSDLSAGRLDLIFLFDNGVATTGPQAKVGQDEVLLVAAPDHPLARASVVTTELLMKTEFLIAEPGCTTHMLVDRLGHDLTHRAPVAMITGSMGALLAMIAHGQGVALLPALTAARYLTSGELIRLNVPDGLATVHIEARWRTGLGPADEAVQAVLRLARRHIEPVPQASVASGT